MGFDPNQQMQQTLKVVEESHDKWHHLVDVIGNTIGWANVFWIFVAGVFGLAGFLLRKWLKKRIGEQLKVLSDWLNKE